MFSTEAVQIGSQSQTSNGYRHWMICLLAVALGCSPTSMRRELPFRAYNAPEQATTLGGQASPSIALLVPPVPSLSFPHDSSDNSVVLASASLPVSPSEYRDLTLQETIRIAMTNSNVLRDLGGRLVSQPNQAITTNLPQLVRSDARTGVDAALAAFDLQWKGTANFSQTQNGLRNPIIFSPITEIEQLRGLKSMGMTKVGQAGTRYSVSQGTLYDADNVGVPPSRFGKAFDTFLSLEARHPLGRGGGRDYNAIAGPNSPFGTFNGYWIANIRGEIADEEIKIALRDYLFNVVRSYWLLRFAYDSVEVRKRSKEIASELLSLAEEKSNEGVLDPILVMQAQERYLAAEQAYENALVGAPERILAGILGPNGALVSGTEIGLRAAERRLRLLIGLPNDPCSMLRPIDQPIQVPVHFDFQESLYLALQNRPELQRQWKAIEQRRLEWIAARNLRLPSIDLVGQYRIHGFGRELFGNGSIAQESSTHEFFRGELQDFTAGVEITRPSGNRLAATAERNAMASISRETAIREQQELEISYEVSSALAEVERSQKALQLSEARWLLAQRTIESLLEKYENGYPVTKESVLEAQRNLSDLELGVSIARVDCSIALISLSLARGTLLSETSIFCQCDLDRPPMPIADSHVKSLAEKVNPRGSTVSNNAFREPVKGNQDRLVAQVQLARPIADPEIQPSANVKWSMPQPLLETDTPSSELFPMASVELLSPSPDGEENAALPRLAQPIPITVQR